MASTDTSHDSMEIATDESTSDTTRTFVAPITKQKLFLDQKHDLFKS